MAGDKALSAGGDGVVVAHLGEDVGVAVILAALIVAGVVISRLGAHRESRPRLTTTALVWIAVGGIAFQVFHFAEHLLQAGYWVLNPGEAPWLTPWAAAGRDVLASAADGQAATGNELLHLGGNAVFLAGLIAAVVAVRASGHWQRSPSGLRLAVWTQSIHVGLHIALTVTWLTFHQAHGLSTLFGLLEPGTVVANAMRVWVHFAINLVATVYAVIGLWQIRTMVPGLPRRQRRSQPAAPTGQDPVTPDEESGGASDDAARAVEEVPTGRR